MSAALATFLRAHKAVVEVRVHATRGSTPREEGARLYVAAGGLFGTIGGGQLEYMAIDEARRMLRQADAVDKEQNQKQKKRERQLDIPLGPEIGQCCGGRVVLALTMLDERAKQAATTEAANEEAGHPAVLIFGAGHVGRALAQSLSPLPLRPILVDSRAEELALYDGPAKTVLTPLPEASIRTAPAGAAFIIATHDHSLDFILAAEALMRDDATYVGMIGSATKRAIFTSFMKDEHGKAGEAAMERLICPIGVVNSGQSPVTKDKRPAVIAAFVTAEVLSALSAHEDTATLSPAALKDLQT